MGEVALPLAFGLGIASFASPCVVPMVPVYFANIAGLSVLGDQPPSRRHILINTALFILGFSVVFILVGTVINVAVGGIPMVVRQRVAGSLLILFGILLYAATKIPSLNYQLRPGMDKAGGRGYIRSFLLGGIFAIGWTPCIGPIIGGVLAMASYGGNVAEALLPLSAYSMGLGVPFLVMGALLGTPAGTRLLRALTRRAYLATIIGAAILVTVGILMFFGII
ncbi:MAG: cytochrome c biogenesis CcdA family protein [Chloroflexota bacterium]